MTPQDQLLQNIHDELVGLREAHTGFAAQLATISSSQATFTREILGNGQPGRLSKLEALGLSNTRYIDQVRGALVIVGTVLVASVTAVITAFVKHVGR